MTRGKKWFAAALTAAMMLAALGCDEIRHPGIGTDRIVLYVDGDVSGSISDEALGNVRDRMAGFIREFSKVQVLTHISWFAKQSGGFYDGTSHPVDTRNAIDNAMTREALKGAAADKTFVGTNLSAYLGQVCDQIALMPEGKSPRLHIVYIVTDGGLTEDEKVLQEAARRLAQKNVIVVIAGASGAAGTRNAELSAWKLKPLKDAKKLVILHEQSFDTEYAQFINPLLVSTGYRTN